MYNNNNNNNNSRRIMTYSGAEQSGTSYTIKTLHKISWET